MRPTLLIVLATLLALPGSGQAPLSHEDRTLVLLPIVSPREVAGGYGALWSTSLRVRNDSDDPITLEELDCPSECFLPASREILLDDTRSGDGIVLALTPEEAEALHFSLRLEESSSDVTRETELPVVREEELETGRIYLIGAPVRENQRVNLRHYLVDTEDPDRFHTWLVAVNDSDTGAAMGAVFIGSTLSHRSSETIEDEQHRTWDAGVTSLTSIFEVAHENGSERVTIRISPMIGAGARYWAFLSIIDNETNEVELVTPQ